MMSEFGRRPVWDEEQHKILYFEVSKQCLLFMLISERKIWSVCGMTFAIPTFKTALVDAFEIGEDGETIPINIRKVKKNVSNSTHIHYFPHSISYELDTYYIYDKNIHKITQVLLKRD